MAFFNNKGVALIQVLLMTAVMSLIAIQFSKTAQRQVDTALDFKDRVNAELHLKTAKSQVIYSLFKYDAIQLSDRVINGVKWNLRGTNFQLLANAKVSIVATSAYISTLTTPREYLLKLFQMAGADEMTTIEIVDSLKDWQDADDIVSANGAESTYYQAMGISPRNGPMQHISELKYLKGMTPEIFQRVKGLLTIYPTHALNPALAPNQLLNIVFTQDIAEQITKAQQQGRFNEQVWQGIVGTRQYPFIDIHPGSLFKVKISVESGDVILTDAFDIKIESQKASNPISILARY